MLHMEDSTIIWKGMYETKAKHSIDIDSYTFESLATEFERRYGKIAWFQNHTENMEILRSAFAEYVAHTQNIDALIPLAEAILQNQVDTVSSHLHKPKGVVQTLRLLTSQLELAR